MKRYETLVVFKDLFFKQLIFTLRVEHSVEVTNIHKPKSVYKYIYIYIYIDVYIQQSVLPSSLGANISCLKKRHLYTTKVSCHLQSSGKLFVL